MDCLINWHTFVRKYQTKLCTWPRLPSGPVPMKVRYVLRVIDSMRRPKVNLIACKLQILRRAVIDMYLRCFICGRWIADTNVLLSQDIIQEQTHDVATGGLICTGLSIHVKIKTKPWCERCPDCNKAREMMQDGDVFVRPNLLLVNANY